MESAPNNLHVEKGIMGTHYLEITWAKPSAEVTFLPTAAKTLLSVSYWVLLSINYESLV